MNDRLSFYSSFIWPWAWRSSGLRSRPTASNTLGTSLRRLRVLSGLCGW